MNANETARKIVGDYVVSVCGFPSLSAYDKMKGGELVSAIEKELSAAILQVDEWEKLVRETANALWDMGKSIRKHHDSSDPGHKLMSTASNLHRACGVMRGEKPLPLAGERLTAENVGTPTSTSTAAVFKRPCVCPEPAGGSVGAQCLKCGGILQSGIGDSNLG